MAVAVAVLAVEAVTAVKELKAVDVAVAVVAEGLATGAVFWNDAGGRIT